MSEHRRRSHAAEAEAARALEIRRQEDWADGGTAVAQMMAHLARGAHRPSAAAAVDSARSAELSPLKRRRLTAEGATRRAREAATTTTEEAAAAAGPTRAVTQRTTTATTAVGAAAAATEAVAAAATDGTATATAGSAGSTTATAEGEAAAMTSADSTEPALATTTPRLLRRPAGMTRKQWQKYKTISKQRAQRVRIVGKEILVPRDFRNSP